MLKSALSHAAHLLVEAAIGVLGLLALAACVLAWRLAQGPIDVTNLARRAETELAGPGTRVAIGEAALAWEGFRQPDLALDLRVRGVVVTAPDASILAKVPQARVTLAILPLLAGRIVPRTVDIDGAAFELRRGANGAMQLDLGGPGGSTPPASPGGGLEILRELARPARPGDNLPWLSQLRRVEIRHARATVRDAALGVVWEAPDASADFKRRGDGGVAGTARLDLAVGGVRATLAVQADLQAGGTRVTATTTPVSPAALARASPHFGALATLDAPVSGTLEASLDQDMAPSAARLTVTVGGGTVHAGQGSVALEGAAATLSATPSRATLDALRVAFAALPVGHGPPPVLTGHAEAARRNGRIDGSFAVDVPRMALADLGAYWPVGTGGGSRGWLVDNLGGGQARGAHVEGGIEAAPDLSDASLTSLSGGMDADDVQVAWLSPIPPITHGRAHLAIEGPDALRISFDQGVQGALRLTDGLVRITGLAARHQFGVIDIGMTGPLAEALKLLDHPRLKLLSRRNLDLTDPDGSVRARLSVKLPLEAKVGMDDIAIAAKARLSDVHLGNVAAGRALSRGQLALDVDSNGLKLAGTGDFAGIPSKLALDMDFRNGAPDQVLEHLAATGRADAGQLILAGAPDALVHRTVTAGMVGLTVDYAGRRDGQGTVQFDAALDAAALATPLGWSKPAGPPATLSARLLLRKGVLIGADRLRASGPGLSIASHADYGGGRLSGLVLDRLVLGGTDAVGRLAFASRPDGAFRVTLRGGQLDLAPYLDAQAKPGAAAAPPQPRQAPEAAVRGPPWRADIHFDRVILKRDEILAPLTFAASNDGLRFDSLALDAGQAAGIHASIAPAAGGRRVVVDAADAGAVLTALGIAGNLRGGRLSLRGAYAGSSPDARLAGTATLSEFNVTDAPAIGRLLQAMTLYGLADLLRGPGLHFTRLVAPFIWQQRVLHLDQARAFSSSLGLTAGGDIDLGRRSADVRGTVVPAYFFNQLPGKLPVVGRLFSPEKGGGLFAARYAVKGSLDNPSVSVNPLSVFAPGALRGVFGLFSGESQK